LVTVEADDQHAVLCSARLSDTASQLVEVTEMTADWLANFRVTRKLRESYKVVKLASKIRIRHLKTMKCYDIVTCWFMTKDTTNLRRFYDIFTMVLRCFVNYVT